MLKPKFLLAAFLLFSFFISQSTIYSQPFSLQYLHPKPSGEPYRWCKIWDVDNFCMAGDGGIFVKTTNGGVNWFVNLEAGRPGPSHINTGHAFDMQNIIVAGVGGTMRTTDGGLTFDSIPGTFTNTVTASVRGVYFLNSNTGYLCGDASYFKKTTDGGNTWNSIPTGIPGHYMGIHTLNDTLIIIAMSTGSIIRSSDGGTTWAMIGTGPNSELWAGVKLLNKDTLVVAGLSNTFRISTDGGLTWHGRNPPALVQSAIWYMIFTINNGANNEIFLVGHNQYICQTTDLGLTWNTTSLNIPNQIYFSRFYGASILNSPDTMLVVGLGSIKLKKGNSVTELINGVRFSNIATFIQNNNGIWADETGMKIWAAGEPQIIGTTYDQILYSSDGGANWTSQSTVNSYATFFDIKFVDSNTGYSVGNANVTGGEIIKTTNGGLNWFQLNSPTTSWLKTFSFINPNTGWIMGNNSALFKTIDGGISWTQQFPTFNTGTGSTDKMDIDMIDENTGWIVGGTEGSINKTTNGGNDWIAQVSNSSQFARLSTIKMLNANTGYLAGASGSTVGLQLMRKTTNGGANWDTVFTPATTIFLDLDFIDEMNGAAFTLGQILITSDGGQSWMVLNGFATGNHPRLKMVSATPPLIYFSGSRGSVLKYGDKLMGTENPVWTHNVPEEYVLKQNYPNPFNPSTTIEFAIPKQGIVSLKIYDIAGREVRTLINNLELNAGTVKQTLDGSSLASGVYFYSLVVDNKVVGTKKMILLR